MDANAYDEIVSSLYHASTGLRPWAAVLDDICSAFAGYNAHLMGLDLATGTMLFSQEGGNPPAQGTLDYIRTWHRRDPRAALVVGHEPGRWFHCHEHFDDAFVAANDFYQEFLLPYGLRYISGFRFDTPKGTTCIFSVSRPVGSRPFDEDERDALQRLGRHVANAYHLQDQIKQTVRVAFAGYAVLERLQYPVFVLDDQRCILFRNAAAEGRDIDEFAYVADGKLRLRVPDDDLALTAAVKTTLTAGTNGSGGEGQAFIRLQGRASHNPALLHLSGTRPQDEMGAFGPLPTVIVTFFLCAQKNSVDPYVVGVAFGLSPAEAKVATAIAEGASVKAIARRHQTSEFTVRAQLKSVYDKIGVHRQAELTQLLVGNPAFWSRSLVA